MKSGAFPPLAYAPDRQADRVRKPIMDPTIRPLSALKLTVFCSALLWGYTSAHTRAPIASLPSAAQAVQAACSGSHGNLVARTELFFGLARPDGSMVSANEFQQFVDQEVTPRFPAGLTLLGGNGQFRNASGATVKENAKLLILLYPYDRDSTRRIEAIRTAYATVFQQETVLRVDGSSCMS